MQIQTTASHIRSEATRLAQGVSEHEDDYYIAFVRRLHQITLAKAAPRGLRFHARVALFEMGEN